ncbi:DUF1127 domain-containing protein [Devosia sp. PTR5]|uniref:DUF1127 domain-containing protein n=1 Tax=Devosia oryzisoli TaxID=2774138 RepID=A0A927ITR4_9HYPH|nr:DUF1127 domain-containing protein [Devosia oryzisoli]MBD8066093.1 DUF1127 domain-containing protein [Devosia oryzisoli]
MPAFPIFNQIAARRRRRITALEISALPEHRLADLGLSRLDLVDAARQRHTRV